VKAHPRSRYVTASPETWSLIRGAYLSGLSAPTVAARFGVSETALRKRARREGWTKRLYAARATPWNLCAGGPGRAGTAPADATAPEAATEAKLLEAWTSPMNIRPDDLARRALANAAHAVKAGEGLNAVRLARAAAEIARLNDLLDWAEADPAREEAAFEARQGMMRMFVREQALRLAQDMVAGRALPPEYEDLKAELARLDRVHADWSAEQAARYPDADLQESA
jgi:hypothetical protein